MKNPPLDVPSRPACPSVSAVQRVIESAQAQGAEGASTLQACLTLVMRHLLRPGDLVLCNTPASPVWLFQVRVTRGDSKGCNAFLLTTEPCVQVNVKYPDLSRWTCNAVPVAPGGSVGFRKGVPVEVVTLSGEVCSDWNGVEDPSYAALLRVVQVAVDSPSARHSEPAALAA